jgi:hypothetical protein
LVHIDIYNNVIDCSGVYIKVIATKLAAQSIEFEVGGGKMPRILNTRIISFEYSLAIVTSPRPELYRSCTSQHTITLFTFTIQTDQEYLPWRLESKQARKLL